MPAGTYYTQDFNAFDLAVSPVNPNVIDYGEDKLTAEIRNRMLAHNKQLVDTTSAFAFWTTENQMPFGGYDAGSGGEIDPNVGRGKPEKGGNGQWCGLPLRKWGYGWQGSYEYFMQVSAARVARDSIRMMDADARYVTARVLDALFNPVNYDHVDRITINGVRFPSVPMHVKALANNDGFTYPSGPNGEVFDGTHNHYAATTDFTAASVSATVLNVREHTADSVVEIWIPQGLEAGIRAMTSNFREYPVINVVPSDNTARILTPSLDMGNPYDRVIGEFDGAKVRVKPQMPTGYLVAIEMNSEMKPVALRYNDQLGGRELKLVVKDEVHPLRAETSLRYIGAGVWNRVGAAILKPNNADTTYVAPSFPALAA